MKKIELNFSISFKHNSKSKMDLNFNDNLEKTRIFILDNVPYIVLTYIFWTLLHYICAHLYIQFCVGNSLWGLLTSPLYSSAPHCQALSWTIYTLSQKFIAMWPLLATYLLSRCLLEEK